MTTQEQMSQAKADLQLEARGAWHRAGRKGTFAAATGMGKTKPAIDEMMELWRLYLKDATDYMKWSTAGKEEGPVPTPPKMFLVVPTETLRDTGWLDEVRQWYSTEGEMMWRHCVTAVCYISMHKYRGGMYDLVVLDEGHHLTQLSDSFFDNNIVQATLLLTATYPSPEKDPFKYDLLHRRAPVVFTYPLEQGVEDGILSDFEITVVLSTLDDTQKIIDAGTKAKPYKTTEKKHYEYLSASLKRQFAKQNSAVGDRAAIAKTVQFMMLRRARFIYDLPSKTRLAQAIIQTEAPVGCGKRTLVFAGSIAQANVLGGGAVYHSKSKGDWLEHFKDKRADFLVCVNSLNEGVNIPMLDQSIIVQASSNPREMVQRVGRNVRWRANHTARIWVVCVQDTQDEVWVKAALAEFDPARIKYVQAKAYGC